MFCSARFFEHTTRAISSVEAEPAAVATVHEDAAERHGTANRPKTGAAAKPYRGWRRWSGRH